MIANLPQCERRPYTFVNAPAFAAPVNRFARKPHAAASKNEGNLTKMRPEKCSF